jgi:hypothetical protein
MFHYWNVEEAPCIRGPRYEISILTNYDIQGVYNMKSRFGFNRPSSCNLIA